MLTIAAFGAIFAGLEATVLASDVNSTTTDATPTATILSSDVTGIPFGGCDIIFGDQGFRGGPGGPGGRERGFGGAMANIEISSEYNQTINSILGNDSDVKNLISQGYNITSIRLMIKRIIGADGTLTTKATTATVTLQNGSSGYAKVDVDITNSKVTQITILTRTVIDKSTS